MVMRSTSSAHETARHTTAYPRREKNQAWISIKHRSTYSMKQHKARSSEAAKRQEATNHAASMGQSNVKPQRMGQQSTEKLGTNQRRMGR